MTATLDDEVAELRRANAELHRRLNEAIAERNEALDQQTATAEVLQVINSSPGNLAPVFDAMLERAMRLCEAAFGLMFVVDGNKAHIVASRDVPEALSDYMAQHPPEIRPADAFWPRRARTGDRAHRRRPDGAALSQRRAVGRRRHGSRRRSRRADGTTNQE